MTVSAQIALFVFEMRQHLIEEIKMLERCNPEEEGTFKEGFFFGLDFWQSILSAEEDFFYALDVLTRMAEPIGINLPDISRPQLKKEGALGALLEEISYREKSLAALQRELLELNPLLVEESFSKEIRDDFKQTFEESLEELLR